MDEFITMKEHEEFAQRVDAANEEQNRRLAKIEDRVEAITQLTVAVEKIAISLDLMNKELAKYGARLEEIEKQPAKRWDTLVMCIVSGVVGAIISYVSTMLLSH